MLVAALLAILIWWQVDSDMYAVLLAIFINIVGYGPTIRKTHVNPAAKGLRPGSWGLAITSLPSCRYDSNLRLSRLSRHAQNPAPVAQGFSNHRKITKTAPTTVRPQDPLESNRLHDHEKAPLIEPQPFHLVACFVERPVT